MKPLSEHNICKPEHHDFSDWRRDMACDNCGLHKEQAEYVAQLEDTLYEAYEFHAGFPQHKDDRVSEFTMQASVFLYQKLDALLKEGE